LKVVEEIKPDSKISKIRKSRVASFS